MRLTTNLRLVSGTRMSELYLYSFIYLSGVHSEDFAFAFSAIGIFVVL